MFTTFDILPLHEFLQPFRNSNTLHADIRHGRPAANALERMATTTSKIRP